MDLKKPLTFDEQLDKLKAHGMPSMVGIDIHRDLQFQSLTIRRRLLVIIYASDGKLYLYDVIDIKKETSNLLES